MKVLHQHEDYLLIDFKWMGLERMGKEDSSNVGSRTLLPLLSITRFLFPSFGGYPFDVVLPFFWLIKHISQ